MRKGKMDRWQQAEGEATVHQRFCCGQVFSAQECRLLSWMSLSSAQGPSCWLKGNTCFNLRDIVAFKS